MLLVDRAGVADAETIAALGRTTFTETFAHLFSNHLNDLQDYLDATFAPAKIAGSLGMRSNAYWIAWREGLPIGYTKLKLQSNHPDVAGDKLAQLQKIYLLQAHLGDGAGQPLLDAVTACARANGCDQLWLTVLNTNDRAIRFYERNGWIKCAKDTHSIGAQRFVYDVLSLSIS